MYIYFGTIIQLIQYAGVVEWFFHGMVGVALLILRKRNINIHKPSKVCFDALYIIYVENRAYN